MEVSEVGRTVLPIAQILQQERDEWAKFRRALRKEDQRAFDEMFDIVKYHSAACAYASRSVPMESIVVSILIEHQKTIARLREQVKELQKANRE